MHSSSASVQLQASVSQDYLTYSADRDAFLKLFIPQHEFGVGLIFTSNLYFKGAICHLRKERSALTDFSLCLNKLNKPTSRLN